MSDEQERAAVRAMDLGRPVSRYETDIDRINRAEMAQQNANYQQQAGQQAASNQFSADLAWQIPHAQPSAIVQEGPVFWPNGEDGPEDDPAPGILLSQLPFVERLAAFLRKSGVVTSFSSGARRLGDDGYVQLDVRKSIPENMGTEIIRRCGKSITFSEMHIPTSGGVVNYSYSRSGDIWVRHLCAYRIERDDFCQRWDVLVRKT